MLAGPDAAAGHRIAPHSTAAGPDRVDALTGLRALAALLIVATHAAFATGRLPHGFLGAVYARLEIGVPIFFALSGFLLFRPWVRAAAAGGARPPVRRYARHRIRRVMPAYVVAVLVTFAVYAVHAQHSVGPNPGQSWHGLLRYLTLTQIYTDDYLLTYLHPGLSQMWSLAVEVAFYALLPVLAYGLLTVLCDGAWRPGRLLAGLAGLAAVGPVWLVVLQTTDWLPNSAGMWLPAHLGPFAGGMALAVLHVRGVGCRPRVVLALAAAGFLAACTPLAGGVTLGPVAVWQPVVKAALYAAVATLVLAPLVLAPVPAPVSGPVSGGAGVPGYRRLLGSRPVVWLGEISYEIFLLHVVVMAVTMSVVLRWPLFTGSTAGLWAFTLAITLPSAWLLHRLTAAAPAQTRARNAGTSSRSARPRCEAASLSCGLSSAAERSAPSGTKMGS